MGRYVIPFTSSVTLVFGIKTPYSIRSIFIYSPEVNVVFMNAAGRLPGENRVFIEQTGYLYILIVPNLL